MVQESPGTKENGSAFTKSDKNTVVRLWLTERDGGEKEVAGEETLSGLLPGSGRLGNVGNEFGRRRRSGRVNFWLCD